MKAKIFTKFFILMNVKRKTCFIDLRNIKCKNENLVCSMRTLKYKNETWFVDLRNKLGS